MRCLYASPVGKNGRDYLAKTIRSFGTEFFDYLIFIYDDTDFNETIFRPCRFVREKGCSTYFFKHYLTPPLCAPYDYVLPWMDDMDVGGFSVKRFLDIMRRNRMEVAQPALNEGSFINHDITAGRAGRIGRLTSFVEYMAQVFTRTAWEKYRAMLGDDFEANPFGWGYDVVARKACGYERMGIVDCERVTHTRSFRSVYPPLEGEKLWNSSLQSMARLLEQYGVEKPDVCDPGVVHGELY